MTPEATMPDGRSADARGGGAKGKRRRALLIAVAMLALAGGAGWKMFGAGEAEASAPPVPVVQAAHPLLREVTQWDDYVGRFAPSRTVDVRPRVSGAITRIHFRDGDTVRKGQVLFTVDQRPYGAALAEARAEVSAARSALALASSDYERVAGLSGDEAMAASEVDQLRARLRAARAGLQGAEARERQRALDLEFATVRAPISGRISDRRVDVGNLVSGGNGTDASLLTTINALDPIYFNFDASEALFLKTRRDDGKGKDASRVEVRLQDESAYRWKGKLDFTDNGIDPHSGTIRIRAVLDNHDGFLTPGMFGNMRLAQGGTVKALLVPDDAVHPDQARKVVLTVGKDDTVVAKPVETGPLIGGLRVVQSGLLPSDRVIVSNYQAAMAGAQVRTSRGSITLDPGAGSAPVKAAANRPEAAQATLAD